MTASMSRTLRTAAVLTFGLLMLAMSLTGCREQGPTVENYQRIEPGMTFDEVVAILGPNYQRRRSGVQLGDVEVSVESDVYIWRGEGREIVVEFDDGRVEKAEFKVPPRTVED